MFIYGAYASTPIQYDFQVYHACEPHKHIQFNGIFVWVEILLYDIDLFSPPPSPIGKLVVFIEIMKMNTNELYA